MSIESYFAQFKNKSRCVNLKFFLSFSLKYNEPTNLNIQRLDICKHAPLRYTVLVVPVKSLNPGNEFNVIFVETQRPDQDRLITKQVTNSSGIQ
jgi:hypothetical protein